MTESYLEIAPRDPLIARDGRPFGTGQRMHSLDWFYPSVLAGSLRSLLGKTLGGDFSSPVTKELRDIAVAGPFLMSMDGGEIYFPAPRDFEIAGLTVEPLRPYPLEAGGCDLPGGLMPMMPPGGADQGKPKSAPPRLFSGSLMAKWLANSSGMGFDISSGWLPGVKKDVRVHVELEVRTGAAVDEHLFQSVGLAIPEGFSLAARAETSNRFAAPLGEMDCLHPLGGERRLARWRRVKDAKWSVPEVITKAVKEEPKRLRMMLATPAIFKWGWRPDWLSDDLTGLLPESDLEVRLVGVCVDRWLPVSGWSLEALASTRMPGPKAMKRLAPAGSVYFFEVTRGNAVEFVAKSWLRPVSDDKQDCKDGFGLALWGPWTTKGN